RRVLSPCVEFNFRVGGVLRREAGDQGARTRLGGHLGVGKGGLGGGALGGGLRGERLRGGGGRAQARLEPELENLAAEFARTLNESVHETPPGLVTLASHDDAIGALRDLAISGGFALDLQYKGSFDALAALRRGECDVAGFHVPDRPLGELPRTSYRGGLPLEDYRLVQFATRTQGLMVRTGNPRGIGGIADLARPGARCRHPRALT